MLKGTAADRFFHSLSSFIQGLDTKNNVKVSTYTHTHVIAQLISALSPIKHLLSFNTVGLLTTFIYIMFLFICIRLRIFLKKNNEVVKTKVRYSLNMKSTLRLNKKRQRG